MAFASSGVKLMGNAFVGKKKKKLQLREKGVLSIGDRSECQAKPARWAMGGKQI
jgi:hypothetical protein